MTRCSTLRWGLLLLVAAGCAGEKAEGRPWIHDVTIEGVHHLSARDLKKRIALTETSWLGFPKHYLDPFEVETDRTRIEAYYRAHGFFHARVISSETVAHKGPKDHPIAVDVKLVVEEGPRTQVTHVQVDGLESLGAAQRARLERELAKRLPAGRGFDHAKYLAERDHLLERLQKLGHAFAKVEGTVEVDRDRDQATIRLHATPDVVAHYAHLHIRGTARTSEHALAEHLSLRPGARFDPEDLEDARGRLYNLGMFSSVRVEPERAPDDPSKADVIVNVREGTFNDLRVGGGLGFEQQRTDVHASFIYTRRNFLGGLRSLRLRLEPAWAAIPAFWQIDRTGPALLAEAQLTQPDWPLPRALLRFTLGYDVGIEYAYQYHGPRASLSLQRGFWHQHVQVGLSYNFQFLDFFNTTSIILNDPAQAGRLFGYTDPYRLGYFLEEVALDLRDRPLDAHRGFYTSLTAEEGGVYAGGQFTYEKLQPDVRGYVPLGSRLTLALRFQIGKIFVQSQDLASPITRRFYLGGPSSHRGFNYDRLSPQIPSGLENVPPVPVGGDQMVLAQTELRLNVVRLYEQWLSLAAFFDLGNVTSAACSGAICTQQPRTNDNLFDLYYAVGGGLRYKTVIGTVRLDLGVRLNRLTATQLDGTQNADPGQRVVYHLSVGEAF